jgi:hypothetical protein
MFCDDKTSLIGNDMISACVNIDVWPCEALFDGEKGVNKKIKKIILSIRKTSILLKSFEEHDAYPNMTRQNMGQDYQPCVQ